MAYFKLHFTFTFIFAWTGPTSIISSFSVSDDISIGLRCAFIFLPSELMDHIFPIFFCCNGENRNMRVMNAPSLLSHLYILKQSHPPFK